MLCSTTHLNAYLYVFRSVADRFNISKSTCWRGIQKMSNYLLKLNAKKKIIKFPTTEDANRTSTYYLEKYRYPGKFH